jgi:hypothetical protein
MAWGRDVEWESDTAKEYRKRAEELRTTADHMTHEKSRKTLISIAAVYERCAALVERKLRERS